MEAIAAGVHFGQCTDLVAVQTRLTSSRDFCSATIFSIWKAIRLPRRAVESRPSREEKVDWLANSNALEKLSGVKALLLDFLFSTVYFCEAENRGDWI